MSSIRPTAFAASAIAAAILVTSTPAAEASPPEGSQPANAVVMPFDVSGNKAATRIWIESHRDDTEVSLVFWSESSEHLADVRLCLDDGETAEIDPRSLSSMTGPGAPVGPVLNLAGTRGVAIATAYAGCDFEISEDDLVDGALTGTFSITEGGWKRSYDGQAIGFRVANAGGYTYLPGPSADPFEPGLVEARLELPVRVQKRADFSRIFVLSLRENVGPYGAVGPMPFGISQGGYRNSSGERTPLMLPDTMPGVLFGSATGTKDSLLPRQTSLVGGGTLSIGVSFARETTYLVGFHAETAGRLSTLRMGSPSENYFN